MSAIKDKVDEWERDQTSVARVTTKHGAIISVTKNEKGCYQVAYCFWLGSNALVSCDYKGTDPDEAIRTILRRI